MQRLIITALQAKQQHIYISKDTPWKYSLEIQLCDVDSVVDEPVLGVAQAFLS